MSDSTGKGKVLCSRTMFYITGSIKTQKALFVIESEGKQGEVVSRQMSLDMLFFYYGGIVSGT